MFTAYTRNWEIALKKTAILVVADAVDVTFVWFRLSNEGYTYRVVVFNGNCSGIDVRFFRSQRTSRPA